MTRLRGAYTRHLISVHRVTYSFGANGEYRTEWAIDRDGDLFSTDPDSHRPFRTWERHERRTFGQTERAVAELMRVARSTADELRYEAADVDMDVRAAMLRGAVIR